MCCVMGYKLLKERHKDQVVGFLEQLLLQGSIRGLHATGVAFVRDEKIVTRKSTGASCDFIASDLWKSLVEDLPPAMLLHTRYSTSGDYLNAANNQPLATKHLALVHNGLVSQASKSEMEQLYAVSMKTDNDSEILLQHIGGRTSERKQIQGAIATSLEELHKVHPPIFACGMLDQHNRLFAVRDHIRPLWFFLIKEWGLVGFASTQDIILRASKKFDVEVVTWEADPYVVYPVGPNIDTVEPLNFQVPKEARWPRPYLIHDDFVCNKTFTKNGKDLALTSPRDASGDHRKNLRESFMRYSAAAIASWEIDPNYPLMNYLFRRFELSRSQEHWMCWLYGVFYHPGTVWYVFNEFPEYEKVDVGRLERWHAANWKHLRYNTDRKYEKGHFVEMFLSYRDLMGSQDPDAQFQFFDRLLKSKDPVKNFHKVWKELIKLLRFGRYATYIYTEALARCTGMPIQADTMFLKEASSSRAGLCYAIGKPEWAKATLTTAQWDTLFKEADSLMEELQERWPLLGVDPWFMESCFCAFKGFFRSNKGRYLGYYYDRQADEILQMQEGAREVTHGVSYKPLWEFRRECVPWEYLGEYAKPARLKIQKEWEHVLTQQGSMIGLWPMIKRGVIPNNPVRLFED